jgi:hypothetical protein
MAATLGAFISAILSHVFSNKGQLFQQDAPATRIL